MKKTSSAHISLPTVPGGRGNLAERWDLHVGTVQLFVVGPGDRQMFPCSRPSYSGPVGTEIERAIARRAISTLNRRHRENRELGLYQFESILKQAAKKYENS